MEKELKEFIHGIFKIADSHCFYPSTPKKFKENADGGETSLQREIIRADCSVILEKKVHWIDIELPIILNKKSRRKSIDLIGLEEDGDFVICELKYGASKDDPIKASFQLLSYFLCILFNASELELTEVHHTNAKREFNWKRIEIANTKLVVAGDEKYWAKHKHVDNNKIIDFCKSIGLKILYMKIDVDNNVWKQPSPSPFIAEQMK
jgi:hypothetical protein